MALAARAIATYDPAVARALIETRYSGTAFAQSMLSAIDRAELADAGRSNSVLDPYAELEAVLAEPNRRKRIGRLHVLVGSVAADDPASAAALIDSLPGTSVDSAIFPLVEAWSRTDPQAAARWLAGKNTRIARDGLSELARRWGSADFESAVAYGDALTGGHRSSFLTGLARAAPHRSPGELLNWLSRYEEDRAYPELVSDVAQRIAQEDIGAALTLIETLPPESRVRSFTSLLPMLVMEDPEAAMDTVAGLEDEATRGMLLPVASSMWARFDAESALYRVLDLPPGKPRDRAIASVAQALIGHDVDGAIDAIGEIGDADVRSQAIRQVLTAVSGDEEAIGLGRVHGFGRDAVLEMRAHWAGRGPPVRFGSPVPFSSSLQPSTAVIVGEPVIVDE